MKKVMVFDSDKQSGHPFPQATLDRIQAALEKP